MMGVSNCAALVMVDETIDRLSDRKTTVMNGGLTSEIVLCVLRG